MKNVDTPWDTSLNVSSDLVFNILDDTRQHYPFLSIPGSLAHQHTHHTFQTQLQHKATISPEQLQKVQSKYLVTARYIGSS